MTTDARRCSFPAAHDPDFWQSGMSTGAPGPIALTTHICSGEGDGA